MQAETLHSFMDEYKSVVEKRLADAVNGLSAPDILKESMLYSLQAGGKRIRPLLLFATLAAFEQQPIKGTDVAAAVELIHTYSLIHDDLPSMDDDDLRRGKLTNHKVFGEATAILAGDALVTLSFKMISASTEIDDPAIRLALVTQLSDAAGAQGMVGGQILDIEGEGKQLSLAELEEIHVNKTGRLLSFSVLAGAELARASEEQKEKLRKFAHHIGLAFQIRDDILDLEGTEEELGKPVGSDTGNDKNTYPLLLSLEGSKEALKSHINQAKQTLVTTGLNTFYLEKITDLIGLRNS